MPKLIINPGLPGEHEFDLASGITTLGRTQDNGIFVLHKSLSRRHAQFDVVGGKATLSDLGSKNGTFVNGLRIEEAELKVGDRIQCGDVQFSYDRPTLPSRLPPFGPTVIRDIHTAFSRSSMKDILGGQRSAASVLKAKPPDSDGRAQDKLRILLRVSQLLSSPEPIDVLLEKILDLVFQIIDADRAVVLMVNPTTRQLEPSVSKSRGGGRGGEPIFSEHIVGYVREQGVAALFPDAAEDPRLDSAKSIIMQSIRGSLCAPFKPKDEVLGVLYVDNLSTVNNFTVDDLELLTAFANQAAIAIENATLYRRIEEEAVLRNNLIRFFPPTTIQKLMESQGIRGMLGVIETDVTALFADISNFTSISSLMAPRDVLEMLNRYFPSMAEIVFRHEGTLEKYIGDALLAVWGAPFRRDDDVDRAVRAAIEMQRALRELNQQIDAAHGRPIEIHIGLNSGPVAAGNIGSDRYIQYATIGDATNVASRLCSVARPGEILISGATQARLRDPSIAVERLQPAIVKGKDEPLDVYRVRWSD